MPLEYFTSKTILDIKKIKTVAKVQPEQGFFLKNKNTKVRSGQLRRKMTEKEYPQKASLN